MAMGDNLARERVPPRSTLVAPAAARRPEADESAGADRPDWDDLDFLPPPGSPYVAYGRPSNQPEITLHVLLKDGHWRGFAWSNFDSVDTAAADGPGGGPVLVL